MVRTVVLAHAEDWAGFRRAARCLLRADVPPESIHWRIADEAQGHLDLYGRTGKFPDICQSARTDGRIGNGSGREMVNETEADVGDGADGPPLPADSGSACLRLPRRLLAALSLVMLHRAPERLHRLYRFLWRWQREPALRGDPLDPDMKAINDSYREVRHDAHRMLGFVRFRPLTAPGNMTIGAGEGGRRAQESPEWKEWRIAWHEPRHRVLRLVAPHFVRRFPGQRWAILTPDACATWDTARLVFHAGATAAEAPPPDAGETLWLTYYANHFNASRRNPAALRRCMPADYWKNLPEAELVPALLTRY